MADVWNVAVASVDSDGNLSADGKITSGGVVFPTADPLIAGAWWDNAGTLTKSTGA